MVHLETPSPRGKKSVCKWNNQFGHDGKGVYSRLPVVLGGRDGPMAFGKSRKRGGDLYNVKLREREEYFSRPFGQDQV